MSFLHHVMKSVFLITSVNHEMKSATKLHKNRERNLWFLPRIKQTYRYRVNLSHIWIWNIYLHYIYQYHNTTPLFYHERKTCSVDFSLTRTSGGCSTLLALTTSFFQYSTAQYHAEMTHDLTVIKILYSFPLITASSTPT